MCERIYVSCKAGALHQGDVLTDLVEVVPVTNDGAKVRLIEHPFAIVASPMCDLVQDFGSRTNQGKGTIPKVLMFEAVTAEELRGDGTFNTKTWGQVKDNRHERYHFLEAVPLEGDACEDGLPELAVSFARFFAIPTDQLYAQLDEQARRRARMIPPYREHFADRMTFYLGRVGLPRNHRSAPVC